MIKSIFGSLFDMNKDGKLDTWERAAELMFFHDMVMGASEETTEEIDLNLDDFDDDLDFD